MQGEGNRLKKEIESLTNLRRAVESLKPGPLRGDLASTVREAVADAWHELDGGDMEAMAEHKVRQRAGSLEWIPPVLTFEIERHGGTVLGSTRVDVQRWTVDTVEGTAESTLVGHRQLKPKAPPWDAMSAAAEVAEAILDNRDAEWLKWSDDRGACRVNTSKVIPPSRFKQTAAGRRKRFREALRQRLEPAGWVQNGSWWYSPGA